MLKKFILIFLLALLFFVPKKAYTAEKQFEIDVASSYDVGEDGSTEVTQDISITNKTEFYYTPSYTAKVGFSDISSIQAFNDDGTIPTTFDAKDPDNKSVKLTFQKRYAGLDETHKFTLKFITKDIARRQGSIWEVTIPGIEDPSEFDTYTAQISVPEIFGEAKITKPSKVVNSKILKFDKNEIGKSGIYILFGSKQYYKFHLKYNISNPNLFPVRTEIALPPSTNYQNSIITSFSEDPLNVTADYDGNWIAEYKLLPQQKKTVEVKGVVEVLSEAQVEDMDNKKKEAFTAPKKFWDSSDPSVVESSKELKTPEEIYEFVRKNLSYNKNKIATDNLRLGGKGALIDSKNSVCLEFTDLFISLARANGIPARAVEGFAYTTNSKLRPLSLVSDILHAWPEYYDTKAKKWIMVDPTWGNTTNGMDYFNSLDFSHVAFAIKGKDSEYPIPAGGYKFSKESKDVKIEFASPEEFKKNESISVKDTFPNAVFPKFAIQGTVTVKNTGNSPLSDLTVDLFTSIGSKRQFTIDYIPPFGHRQITTSFSDTPILTKDKYIITIQVGKKVYKKSINISFIPDIKLLLILGGIIGVSIITAAVTFHTGSLLVQRRKKKNSIHR